HVHSVVRAPPISVRFPYTTLFRSLANEGIVPDGCTRSGSRERAKGGPLCVMVWCSNNIRRAARESANQVKIEPLHSSAEGTRTRSEEHTSELQSRFDIVCRLLLEH